jgi:small subunit ribosomal protein S6
MYECMFLLDTTKVAGDVQAAAKQLHATLEKYQAEVLASRPWDERRLAYPINGQKKGLYYLIYFRGDSKRLVEIEHEVKLNETVLRHQVIKIHPKLEETMLTLAKDERALALQAAAEDVEGGEESAPMDDRPRRPRRQTADMEK